MKLFLSFLLFSSFLFSQNKELKLFESKVECIGLVESNISINQRIIRSEIIKDTLSMEIKYSENCGNGEIINYSIIKDTVYFNFKLKDYELADCDCFFINKLKFKKPNIKNPIFKLNNLEGIRIIELSDNYYEPKKYVIRDNDSILVTDGNGFQYIRSYYKSGKLASLWIRKNYYSEKIKYYENGRIQSIVQTFESFEGFTRREWDIEGNLTKYENSTEVGRIRPTQEQINEGVITIISKDKNIKK